jgi:hypothetical protein
MKAMNVYMRTVWMGVLLVIAATFAYAQDEGTIDNPVVFSFEQMFYAYFNKTKKTPTDYNTQEFISNVYEDEYRQYWGRNDEFGKRRVLQEVTPKIKDGIANFDSKLVYLAAREISIGEYDFDKEGFPIGYYSGAVDLGDNAFNVLMVFSNSDNFQFFKIAPEKADAFLKSRINWTGRPNRDIIMLFYFKVAEINKAFDDLYKKRGYNAGFLPLHGIIEKVEVYDKYNDVIVGELTKK